MRAAASPRRWVVFPLALLAGCATELVGVSIEPAPVEPPAVTARLDAGIACGVTLSGLEGVTYGPRGREGFRERCRTALVDALAGAGLFAGPVVPSADERAADAACEARLLVEHVSEPRIRTVGRGLIGFTSCVLVGIPFLFLWTDREPELVERFRLEVGVPGEPTAGVYEVVARGTVRAQTPGASQIPVALEEHRATLRHEALRSLVSRLRADAPALDRLRAQLAETPPPDLAPLLVSEETHVLRARWRTRRLIAWTSARLEGWLAELRVPELREQSVRVQTCLVDLSHEQQVQRDRAEAAIARGDDAGGRSSRELSLVYQQRVEALRPVFEAIKEELDARSR